MSRGFRLAAVERIRARRLTDTGQALAHARQALLEAGEQRDLLRQRLLECMPDSSSRPADTDTVGHRRALLRDRISAADAGIRQLQAQVEAARDAWLSAHGELRAVQALHDRHRRAVRADQDRRDQRLADELAAMVHLRHPPGRTGEAR